MLHNCRNDETNPLIGFVSDMSQLHFAYLINSIIYQICCLFLSGKQIIYFFLYGLYLTFIILPIITKLFESITAILPRPWHESNDST